MGPLMSVVYFLLHMVHVVWVRFNRWIAGSKMPKNCHGVLIIGDELAEGIGDYVTLGQVPGLARHLQAAIRASDKIKRPKRWIVRSAGAAGSTSTSWLPPGAPRAPTLGAAADSSSQSVASASTGSSSSSNNNNNNNKKKKSGSSSDRNSRKGKKKDAAKDSDTDDAGFRLGQLWSAALGPKGKFRHAQIVVVAVGSNDYKYDDSRDPDVTRHNLSRICQALVAMDKQVFVVGMRRVLHVKEVVNLQRNALVRDYCTMAASVGVSLHYGPNLHIGSWEHARLTSSDRQNFNSHGYALLVRRDLVCLDFMS